MPGAATQPQNILFPPQFLMVGKRGWLGVLVSTDSVVHATLTVFFTPFLFFCFVSLLFSSQKSTKFVICSGVSKILQTNVYVPNFMAIRQIAVEIQYFTQNQNRQSHGGTREKTRGSPKFGRFILWVSWMCTIFYFGNASSRFKAILWHVWKCSPAGTTGKDRWSPKIFQ